MKKWISIKDQMPKPGQFVLAYGEVCNQYIGGPPMAVFRWYDETWWDANMDAELAYGPPTHWLPLPNAPEK